MSQQLLQRIKEATNDLDRTAAVLRIAIDEGNDQWFAGIYKGLKFSEKRKTADSVAKCGHRYPDIDDKAEALGLEY